MIDPDHGLSIKRQAQLIDIPRGTAYYVSRTTTSDADQALMTEIDRLHLDYPFAGARMLRDMLNRQGHEIGRKHVATLMRKMGIQALYREPNTSKKHPEHTIYPYLPRKMTIERANQVWAMDITYIPMAKGWVYLAAVSVLSSTLERRLLAWALLLAQHLPGGTVRSASRAPDGALASRKLPGSLCLCRSPGGHRIGHPRLVLGGSGYLGICKQARVTRGQAGLAQGGQGGDLPGESLGHSATCPVAGQPGSALARPGSSRHHVL